MLLVVILPGSAAAQQDQGKIPEGLAITPQGEVDWNVVQVLDLRTAEQIALAGNPTIAAAEARVLQAEERISQARSTYWPRLDANAGASRVWLSETEYQTSLNSALLFNPLATLLPLFDFIRLASSSNRISFTPEFVRSNPPLF